jgi:hypothetical protein
VRTIIPLIELFFRVRVREFASCSSRAGAVDISTWYDSNAAAWSGHCSLHSSASTKVEMWQASTNMPESIVRACISGTCILQWQIVDVIRQPTS